MSPDANCPKEGHTGYEGKCPECLDEVSNAVKLVTENAADDAKTAVVPEKKEISEKELRQIRRVFMTKRHSTVEPCGHKLDLETDMKGNCPYCWFVFFQKHGEVVQTSDEVFQKHGKKALEAIKGVKFVKHFLQFMAVLATMKAQIQEETNGEISSTGEPSGSGGETIPGADAASPDPAVSDQGAIDAGGQVQSS
jgi:hypothetical protein